MDYIDRDAAMEAVLDLPSKMDEQGYGWLGRRGVWQMLCDFPAADVRPVVYGKWKRVQWVKDDGEQEGGYWISRCSNCFMPYHSETPYCPHCGADMRVVNNG